MYVYMYIRIIFTSCFRTCVGCFRVRFGGLRLRVFFVCKERSPVLHEAFLNSFKGGKESRRKLRTAWLTSDPALKLKLDFVSGKITNSI